MNSSVFKDENILYSSKDCQRRKILLSNKNKFSKKIEDDNDDVNSIRPKLFDNKFIKIQSKINIKNRNKLMIKKFESLNDDNIKIYNKKNNKIINTKNILPLLKSDNKVRKDTIFYQNSAININSNQIKNKELNLNNLYLEYKYNNYKNKSENESTYIEINPDKIISALSDDMKIKPIFMKLIKKINNNNSKDIDISDSRINIEDILNNLNKKRKNKNIYNHNISNDSISPHHLNNIYSSYNNIFMTKNKSKNNYSIEDLFLYDIINKLIKKSIYLHDKKKFIITEEFLLSEYKNQIKKLKNFFDEKINGTNPDNYFIKKNTNNLLLDINNLKEKINLKLHDDYHIKRTNDKRKNINNSLIFIREEDKFKNNYFINLQEKNSKNNQNNIIKAPKCNIYNFDIEKKINIIDFNELFDKIHKQRVDIMNNNNNINIGENILLKIIKLNKNKIKFKNNEIEKKTKILTNKENNKDNINYINYNYNIYKSKETKHDSRNTYNSISTKRRLIRNELFNDISKHKSLKNNSTYSIFDSISNDSLSSFDEGNYIKMIKPIEKKDKADKVDKVNKYKEKIIIEKLNIKNDFGVTKVGFNKTINQIRKIYGKKHKSIRVNNFSFLNTIYGKINTKRKMKISELDFKEEMRQRRCQLLLDSYKQNELSKNVSSKEINYNQNFQKKITLDKGTNTKRISLTNERKIQSRYI